MSERSERLQNCGFSEERTFPALFIAPEILDLEPFDDFETLHYGLKHYYLGLASNGLELSDFFPVTSEKNCMPHSEDGFIFEMKSEIETSQRMNFGVCQTDKGISLKINYQFSFCEKNYQTLRCRQDLKVADELFEVADELFEVAGEVFKTLTEMSK